MLLRLAFRNLFRHRRRTFLTLAGLAFGVGLMVLGRAWTDAMQRAVVEPAKNATLGHVQVYRSDAAADEGGNISFIMPQNNFRLIENPGVLALKMRAADPRIEGVLARFMIGGLLSKGDVTMDGILIGVDAAARAAVYPDLGLVEGRHLEPGERGILLNRGVAKKLGAKVGDEVVALGTTSDGRMSGLKLTVRGVYTIRGLEAYEWGACYVALETVQHLVDAPDQTGLLVARLSGGDGGASAGPVRDRLNALFASERLPYVAFTWEDMGGPFVGGMLVTKFVGGIMNVVMGVIVAASVLNTVLMAAFERTREIGTMRAVGGRKADVLKLFLLEGSLLGLVGAVLGALFGSLAILYFSSAGIPAFSEAQKYTYGGDRLYPVWNIAQAAVPPLIMFAVCTVASFAPSLLAARRRPADDLRYV